LPLFFLVIFELPFRLHEARSAHFMCIPFEQGEELAGAIAFMSLYAVRVFSLGLFVINVLVNLTLLNDESGDVGVAGYASLHNENSIHFWLSLVPSMALSALALFVSILMQRYARNFTLGIRNSNHLWRSLLPFSILYLLGQCFKRPVYRVTSNAGDVFLLIGITIMVHRVQSDLAVAGSFADFLHRSNAVFRTSHQSEQHRPPSHHHQHAHHQHAHHQHPHKHPPLHPQNPLPRLTENKHIPPTKVDEGRKDLELVKVLKNEEEPKKESGNTLVNVPVVNDEGDIEGELHAL